ncbi:IPI3 [Candida oxycetoniae]|uniref:Pre-rRNA-processing protein IPI3 n=1 Tax=Candida oxycetoniae TaxID=497107 RepID=A0AAI9SXE6_9ASCO|nr:IPI3 [Candida oxycetoniae]KAI3404340.2 IPI3 [Candida oxycetoniae]
MDEVIFYISQSGDQVEGTKDKSGLSGLSSSSSAIPESFAYIGSIHSSKQYEAFRHASSPLNGTAITGIGAGERIFTCDSKRALINVFIFGKESIDQRLPIPEALTTLHVIHHPNFVNASDKSITHKKPNYRVPWLLCGGSKSGKLYIWEFASGDLLCVKEAHYQGITVIQSSSCGTFLITGGEDARVLIWNLADLVAVYGNVQHNSGGGGGNDDDNGNGDLFHHRLVKPYWSISENTLAITDITLNTAGNLSDLKLYTSSKDATVRIYDISTKQQLTTFVLPDSVECLARDPANRQLYVGLSNGWIKIIPLYKYNQHTSVLEAVGGLDKIITITDDGDNNNNNNNNNTNMFSTIVQHENHKVTKLLVSMDGTSLVSGDASGQVYVSDIVTKQTIKSFPSLKFPIAGLFLKAAPIDMLYSDVRADKKHRMLPPLKRALANNDPMDHYLSMDIPQETETEVDVVDDNISSWLEKKRNEELLFKNLSNVNSTVKTIDIRDNLDNTEAIGILKSKLKKVSEAYTDLRNRHEELIKEHAKLLDKKMET